MRRFLAGLVVGLLFAALTASAATLSLTVTSAQVEVGRWKWRQVDPSGNGYGTATAFAQAQWNRLIEQWAEERSRVRGSWVTGTYECSTLWGILSTDEKNAICTAKGDLTGASCTLCQ